MSRQKSQSECPHRPPCPGCTRFGEPGIAASTRAVLDELAHTHGVTDVPVSSRSTAGFRLRARLAIRGRLGSPKLGLFELGTHRVVHIPHCSVQHPLINRVATVVRRALVDTEVTSFSERAQQGLARYLQVVVERSSQTAQVVIVGNCATAEPLAACLDLIVRRLGPELHSLWFNAQCAASNTIFGPDFQSWYGPPSVVERFGGPEVHYPPGAFGQSNLEVADDIIEHLRGLIPQDSRVTEFYAGVGAIGLSVLARTAALRMNEVSAHSLKGLELGLAALDPLERAKICLVPGSAAVASEAAAQADVVIADPPRKGLDLPLLDHLVEQPSRRLLYVSCDLKSLCRDAARLTATGALRLVALRAFNLMPFTEHVETVAHFERC